MTPKAVDPLGSLDPHDISGIPVEEDPNNPGTFILATKAE